MNFLFLFGLVFLAGCVHRPRAKKDIDAKASEVEINKDGGGAFVTPSKDLKALRLQSHSSAVQDEVNNDPQTPLIKLSKESIRSRLVDIPVLPRASLVAATVDSKNNKYLVYASSQSLSDCREFFNEEFERFGWQVRVLYTDDEHVVITTKKPHKYAVISLESTSESWIRSSSLKISITVSVL